LRASSPVWFSGVEVGSVSYLDFVPGSDPPRLKVVMKVERRIQPYLKSDSRAVIQGMGLLGDMYVNLTPGSASAQPVESGVVLIGQPPEDTREEMSEILASTRTLLEHVSRIAAELDAGHGSLGQLLRDDGLYRDLRTGAHELQDFLATMNASDGTLRKLAQDPELYQELVSTVKDIHTVVEDLKQTEQKLLTPETRAALDQTVKTAERVVKRVGEYQEKIDRIRFDFNFGLHKYEGDLSAGHAELGIWPSDQRYYLLGVQKSSRLYGREEDETTYTAQLAWRFFIRGGVIRSDYFVAGMDFRLWDDRLKVLADAYRIELNPAQLDLRTGVMFWDLLELSAGAEDVLHRPLYKAGLILHYRDDDLLNILIKTRF
jgi:phospholipid/cholesterol/gamma-HCH transport system substrate-binding protein